MFETAAAAGTMIWILGLRVENLALPIGMCAVLYVASFFWQPNLLRGLATLVGFSAAFTILMEAVAATNRPLVDAHLAAIDAWFGLRSQDAVFATSRYPALTIALKYVYFSVLPQTALVMLLLAERASLWLFLKRFMIAAQITLCFFFFFPAEGVATSVTPRIAARFHALRNGATIDWQRVEGIITFPSFHTAWAIILTAAFWDTRLRWPAAALNAVMIASTITTGGHYYVDVVAGAVLGVGVLFLPFKVAVVREGPLSLRRLAARRAASTA